MFSVTSLIPRACTLGVLSLPVPHAPPPASAMPMAWPHQSAGGRETLPPHQGEKAPRDACAGHVVSHDSSKEVTHVVAEHRCHKLHVDVARSGRAGRDPGGQPASPGGLCPPMGLWPAP